MVESSTTERTEDTEEEDGLARSALWHARGRGVYGEVFTSATGESRKRTVFCVTEFGYVVYPRLFRSG